MALMRLDKFLATLNVGTRTEVKKYIKNGRIKVNGVVASDAASKIDTEKNEVLFDGVKLVYEEFRYFMLNKPEGCVSATRDKLSDTVISYLDGEITDDLFPVGRLDKDTEGLLIITNDGKLAHNLLSPKKHVDKTYYAKVTGRLTEEKMEKFRTGLDIGDEKKTLPASIRLIGDDPVYEVIIHEGRYHQVKRMFEALGESVMHLKRVAMGNVILDRTLLPGSYRRLTEEELNILKGE